MQDTSDRRYWHTGLSALSLGFVSPPLNNHKLNVLAGLYFFQGDKEQKALS